MESWALVTGATSGIGESFTRLLAKKNYNIVLVARDMPRLQERARELEAKFRVETHIIQADLSTDAGCAAVEQYIANNQVDVLINNAGFGSSGLMHEIDVDRLSREIQLNVLALTRLSHASMVLGTARLRPS